MSIPPPVNDLSLSTVMDPLVVSDVGFSTLHDGGLDPQLDIVFIHGLQGHPRETWSHSINVTPSAKPKSKFLGIGSQSRTPSQNRESPDHAPPDPLLGLWPAKVLSLDFPNARILTYGYDSRVSNFFGGAASQNDWVTIAGGFLNDLAAERVAARKRPLIIVSHSMGGLITKEALRRASTRPEGNADLRDILESTFALVFFGTPHRGGAYTNLGLTATKIAKAAGFDVFDQNIGNLKGNSPVLTLVRQEFLPLLDSDRFQVSTFQESLGYKGTGLLNGKIVPNESSELDHRNERINLINANHMNMCKFKDKNDDGYRKFKAEIARHISRQQQNVQQKCIDSFLIPQMGDRLDQILEAHAETLGWIYDEQGPGIAPWLTSGSGVFWIQGKPGSGKSTAMKFMLQDERTRALLNMGARGVRFNVIGCFFTDRADRVQASWNGILHSMVYQLISHDRAAAHVVLPFWREAIKQRIKGEPLWSVDAIENILRVLKSKNDLFLRVCFLIDAIDEHDGHHARMCKFLHDICSLPGATSVFKVCAASRPENDLRDLFRNDLTISIHDWTRGDMQRFVSQEFSLHPRWKTILVGNDTTIAARLENDIVSRARGVFLWVRLIIRELLEGLTNGYTLLELEMQTNEFPNDIDEFFAHIIKKIDKKFYEELLIIIETLLRCRGALNAVLLKLVIRANLRNLSKNATIPSIVSEGHFDVEGFSRRLQSRCHGLIEMVTSQNTYDVQFLHQTVKEYFLENKNLSIISQNLSAESSAITTSLNGHFFLLNGFLEWFRLREALEPPRTAKFQLDGDGRLEFEGIIRDIIHHTSAIERELHISPVQLLQEIDVAITRQSISGDLWPFEACGMYPRKDWYPNRVTEAMKHYMERERLPKQHSLLMLAIALGWTRYVQQRIRSEAATSIQNVGVCQFAYLCCPITTKEAMPILKSTKCLVDFGIDITKCQDIGQGHQADALGFFVSSHLKCPPSIELDRADRADRTDHYEAIHLLLERGANPSGKCLYDMKLNEEAYGVGTVAEVLISRFGLTASLGLVGLLGAYCPKSQSLLVDLFDTSLGKVFESLALKHRLDETTFIWLRDNGAYISESSASLIYQPLVEGLRHQYSGAKTYSEALKSLSELRMDDPAMSLDRSLMNIYQYELGRDICERDRLLLAPQQRKPEHYDAAARRLVADFNPHWPIEQSTAESALATSPSFLSSRYWQELFHYEKS